MVMPPLFSPRSFTSHFNSQFAGMLQISPSSQAPFKNLIRTHLPSTDPTSLNQADTLLIHNYNSINEFQAWYVQYTHFS